MKVIEVFDDLVPLHLQNQLEDVLLGQHFPWFFWPRAIPDVLKKTNRVDSDLYVNPYQLKHVFNIKNRMTREYDLIMPLVDLYVNRTGAQVVKIHGSAVIMQHPVGHTPTITPHVDFDHVIDEGTELRSLIYYVNDSDGDTILYNEFYSGEVHESLTEIERLSPKRGRAAVFASDRFHSGSLPSNNVRVLMNIIMEVKKDGV